VERVTSSSMGLVDGHRDRRDRRVQKRDRGRQAIDSDTSNV